MARFLTTVTLTLALFLSNAIGAQLPTAQTWSFSGVSGKHDSEQLRRGLQVYEE